MSTDHLNSHLNVEHGDDDDAETASQRSISLSSPPVSPRHSIHSPVTSSLAGFAVIPANYGSQGPTEVVSPRGSLSNRESRPYTLDTDFSSEADDKSMFTEGVHTREGSVTSEAPSEDGGVSSKRNTGHATGGFPTYPPLPSRVISDDRGSVTSYASSSSRKARPESMLVELPAGPLVLGIALVDFNHLVGPRIEFSQGEIFEDEEVAKILPFLALPDGAHLSSEDYSYFHLVPSGPNPSTIFGISCNRQIAASALLVRDVDVTRSTVQKAVVVLASKPVFGPIRDKLGVVSLALFEQRDFRETKILIDFAASLETSLRTQMTESGLYMGTSLRELVHTFRKRTLIMVKALMLQKRIMLYGHPVERLCTYQYSLISLLPGLLQTLDDCGSPPLANRAPTLTRASSLRTSDHKSMMAYLGLPLDIFGKDSFFQPYLPLQQLDMIKETPSWLCGSTNTILTQQQEIDIFVNTETGILEFRDPTLERSVGLTAADRKWMEDIMKDVNESWDEYNPSKPAVQFKGSDDYLRSKFEEYVSAALASVKYRDFISKGEGNGVIISGGTGGDVHSTDDFNPLWIAEFRRTNAFQVWDRITDPLLFDIVEPRHPCNGRPSVVADLGLRLQEGFQELKLEQQLAPTREAINRTITAGQAGIFKAYEGMRERWGQRTVSSGSTASGRQASSASSTPVEVSRADMDVASASNTPSPKVKSFLPASLSRQTSPDPILPAAARPSSGTSAEAKASWGAWSANIGTFLSSRSARVSTTPGPKPPPKSPSEIAISRTMSSNLPSPTSMDAKIDIVTSSHASPTELPQISSPVTHQHPNAEPVPTHYNGDDLEDGDQDPSHHDAIYHEDHESTAEVAGMAL